MTEQEARERVKHMKEFYVNAASFLVMMTGLGVFNAMVTPDFWWFLFPLFGWGAGLVAHYIQAFGVPGLGSGWEQRKLQELMAQERETLTLEEVKHLVDARLEERPATLSTDEVGRLVRRIEHLEAIVTSRDWDLLDADYRERFDPQIDPQIDPEAATDAERTERLSKRVR